MGRVWLGVTHDSGVPGTGSGRPVEPAAAAEDNRDEDDATATALARLARPLTRQPAQQHNQRDTQGGNTSPAGRPRWLRWLVRT